MKKTGRFIGFVTKTAVAVFLSGAFFASTASARTYNVDMELDDSQTEMFAVGRGNCKKDNHPGCVETKKGHAADIHFFLKNAFTDCNRAEGAEWQLSAVYLGGKDSPAKPAAWGNLDAEVIDDFDVADAASGLLNHANGSNQRKISISNKNQHAYSIWYTVVASCVDSAGTVLGTVEVDPRVKNVGN